jgi:hypothetical protein
MRFTFAIHSRKHRSRSALVCAALLIIAAAGCASQPQPKSTPIAESSNPVIVRLVGRREVITITTGPISPLYTVADLSGRVLVSAMIMSDLRKTRPDLYEQISPALSPKAEAWAGE